MRIFRRRHSEPPDPSDEAPGWDAIDVVLEARYPGIEPFHVSPGVGPYLGGGVQGISAYPAEGHWHLVTYGLSELYVKETDNPEISGFGYEMTLRIPRDELEDRPPDWAFVLLERVALTQRQGTDYVLGSRLHVGGPIDGEYSPLTVLVFTPDEQLGTITTPNGQVEFLQLVGVTPDEAERMKESSTAEVLAEMATTNPLLVTGQAAQ